jgi:hypothetical protein
MQHLANFPYWFKVVAFLQQNWAVVTEDDPGAKVTFFSDNSEIFDEMTFPSVREAEQALTRNGFGLFDNDTDARAFIAKPSREFQEGGHPNGRIYSSGEYWR